MRAPIVIEPERLPVAADNTKRQRQHNASRHRHNAKGYNAAPFAGFVCSSRVAMRVHGRVHDCSDPAAAAAFIQDNDVQMKLDFLQIKYYSIVMRRQRVGGVSKPNDGREGFAAKLSKHILPSHV